MTKHVIKPGKAKTVRLKEPAMMLVKEIREIRTHLDKLEWLIDQIENEPDPDAGLEVRPEFIQELKEIEKAPASSFISEEEMRRRMKVD